MYWSGWPLDRIVVLFVAAAYAFIGIQVTMFHYRQNFHHKSMWGPVLSSPVFFLAGLALALLNLPWLAVLFQILMWVGVAEGFVGFYYHFSGVGVRVGGYEPRNFLIGPPVVLPLMFSSLGALGLLALYWR
ncbi:hypothetical protein SD70_23810 [Gordoniibacillus kamchatkensis]|uniref:Uncharacterized protein n=1 Tax=Gordoniibacillus kamchatkensis TaxID=1590651 RepID=A0ABR5ACM7_9BACL|nr:hypothetical protein [Paenibacillus sp. VKM B-2647]KIL38816.1 hypothetical protein SD70_23810 [Paenibacillus sp. VKM B-2647]